MSAPALIDTSFDFRADSSGRDPDTHSVTLRRYHQLLWSKPLPDGALFTLDASTRGAYLHHRSKVGEYFLASDSVIPTFTRWVSMRPIVQQFSEAENEAFRTISYTIGGMMLFPGNRVDGKQTINGARGFTRKIADRFDLTLECIRRHYRSEPSPLGVTLGRYDSFFTLFKDFHGYVDFFLLQDLVTQDNNRVGFFMEFDDFTTPSVPQDIDSYNEYRRLTIDFVMSRNRRIEQWVAASSQPSSSPHEISPAH